MRKSSLTLLLTVFSFMLLGCTDSSGPPWEYLCEAREREGAEQKKACYFQFSGQEHLYRLIRSDNSWLLWVAYGSEPGQNARRNAGHASGQLKATPSNGAPIELAASRGDGTCSSSYCMFKLSNDVFDSVIKAEKMSVSLRRARLERQRLSHLESTEDVVVTGLRASIRKAGVK